MRTHNMCHCLFNMHRHTHTHSKTHHYRTRECVLYAIGPSASASATTTSLFKCGRAASVRECATRLAFYSCAESFTRARGRGTNEQNAVGRRYRCHGAARCRKNRQFNKVAACQPRTETQRIFHHHARQPGRLLRLIIICDDDVVCSDVTARSAANRHNAYTCRCVCVCVCLCCPHGACTSLW